MKVPFKPGKYPRNYDPQKVRVHELQLSHNSDVSKVICYGWFHVDPTRVMEHHLQDIYSNIADLLEATLPEYLKSLESGTDWKSNLDS
jgi:hypothetical protein